ncbi:MAG: hypothetical protein K2Q34_03595, partial [Alphaproteobacteria bacterium]|nr:hypothetical protein [Alphaproteobacteria bacterium]
MKILFIAVFFLFHSLAFASEPVDAFSYFEFYRAKKGEKTVYIHGTLHSNDPAGNPLALNAAIYGASAIHTENFSSVGDYKAELSPEARLKLQE